jgi:hypothetical protein
MAAGLGFKTFATGDVLTAGDTNGYLMQGVWVFADAAARSAAVTSPQEGNISYLKDTNSTEYYSGSAWVAIGGSSSPTFVGCSLNSSTNQSVSNDTFTAITWNQEDFDTSGFHSTSSNTSRITIPADKAGKYQVNAFIQFDDSATGQREFNIYKNGTSVKRTATTPGSNTFPSGIIPVILDLAVSDYIEVYVYQSSGSTKTLATSGASGHFSVSYLGA